MAHEGTKKVFRFDAMRRTPRLVKALARHMGTDEPTMKDMGRVRWSDGHSPALDAIAEYKMARSTVRRAEYDPRVTDAASAEATFAALGQTIRAAIADR